MPTCRECGLPKPPSAFHPLFVRGEWDRQPYCADCHAEMSRLERTTRADSASRRQARDSYLRSKYGITIDDYDQMADRQSDRCAICRESHPGMLVIDHCHATGRVRGLLCGRCNYGLGNFRDNPLFLEQAMRYLV